MTVETSNNKKIMLIGLILIINALSGCIETGGGTVVDTVYDVGLDGIVWKTYIIYLTNDHPSKGQNSYSAIYTADKDNQDLIRFLENARDNQKKVKIYYKNNLFYLPWEHTSNAVALIYKAEYVNSS
jgi:hypothetical protein